MYYKIQPEQVQLHAFSSPSGDLNFDIGSNFVYANLSRFLTGNFNIQGELNINGSPIFTSDSSNAVTGSNSFSLGGTNNNVSGDQNAFINSYSSSSLGTGNLGINTISSSFSSGTTDNTILAGRGVNLETGVVGSTVIKDKRPTSLNVTKSESLIISFESGVYFDGSDVTIDGGDLYVGVYNSGLFSGNLNTLGTIFENGVPVATTGDLGVTSGVLNTRILSTGAYAVTSSGLLDTKIINTGSLLDTRILSTGLYAVGTSGLLDTRIINTGSLLDSRLLSTGLYSVTTREILDTRIIDTGWILDVKIINTGSLLDTQIINTGSLLDTRIINTGSLLNSRILSTGLYSVTSSGLLNTRLNTAVFASGTQTISGQKGFHQNLNLAQSLSISGASGILTGAGGRTQIVPASSGDSAGNRGLIAYSGQFLYLKISDSPHIWARHSGTLNWP
jgi:hypothetical protein